MFANAEVFIPLLCFCLFCFEQGAQLPESFFMVEVLRVHFSRDDCLELKGVIVVSAVNYPPTPNPPLNDSNLQTNFIIRQKKS